MEDFVSIQKEKEKEDRKKMEIPILKMQQSSSTNLYGWLWWLCRCFLTRFHL